MRAFAELPQGAVDRRGGGALLLVEVTVARGQREAIGGAHRRLAEDLHRQVEVADQLADHRQLLEILFAEQREVRLDHVQQLADHGRHAFEMAGTTGAAKAFGDAGNMDAGLPVHAVGVHFLDGRGEQQVAAGFEQAFLVGCEGSRVFVEVFAGAELQRVDEDADDHEVGAFAGFLYQRGMAGVEVAHGRHEADALAFAAGARHRGAQFTDGLDGVHALNPCSAAGKDTSLTART
ncbi:hypothetical protein Z046_26780 [Pseudomonas aeruginosa VRFPA09]|nr:hypothetical protein Z046_26780 [Pseudomonas aeruginosa VRFPA09]